MVPGSGLNPRPGMTKLYAAGLVCPFVPAQAGTQQNEELDSRFRGNDRMGSGCSLVSRIIAGLKMGAKRVG
jgi:hypothetical protein